MRGTTLRVEGADVTFTSSEECPTTLQTLVRAGTLRFGADQTMRDFEAQIATEFQSLGAGAGDRKVTLLRRFAGAGAYGEGSVTFIPDDEAHTGRFIFHSSGSGTATPTGFGMHTLAMETLSNTVIQIDPEATAQMTFGANTNIAMVVSGAGSLWKSNAGELLVKTVNTYSGRTMIEGGTLKLASYDVMDGEERIETFYGQLPTATVVEIAADATFDLNGIDQTVGGVKGFRGLDEDETESFGTVVLGGAQLTVNAAQDSTFGGTLTGAGALVKEGAATFTLSAGYTNAAGRLLRVADGILAVDGTLNIAAGDFELAGGRVTAGSLAGAATWDVTLSAACEDAILVDISGTAYDIAGSVLDLKVAADYTPLLGAQFTLLRADDMDGQAQGGTFFWYSDGSTIEVDDILFELSWAPGSDAVVLKVIPEPGALTLFMLAAGALLIGVRFRRRFLPRC